MDLTQINVLHKKLQDTLSAFLKVCPKCNSTFKDSLDRMIFCKECDREDKINKLLNDKSHF